MWLTAAAEAGPSASFQHLDHIGWGGGRGCRPFPSLKEPGRFFPRKAAKRRDLIQTAGDPPSKQPHPDTPPLDTHTDTENLRSAFWFHVSYLFLLCSPRPPPPHPCTGRPSQHGRGQEQAPRPPTAGQFGQGGTQEENRRKPGK